MKLRITVEGKSYDVEVEVHGDDGVSTPVPAAAPVAKAAPVASSAPAPAAPAAPAPAPAAAPSSGGGGDIFRATIAGTVRAIHVKPGDAVEANQEIMMIEAMKMETAVAAPKAGKIRAILVSIGEAVQSNQGLVEYE